MSSKTSESENVVNDSMAHHSSNTLSAKWWAHQRSAGVPPVPNIEELWHIPESSLVVTSGNLELPIQVIQKGQESVLS